MTNDPLDLPPAGDVMGIAMRINAKTPYIYDKQKMFWLWRGNHYVMADMDDMLSLVYDHTVDSKYLSGNFKAGVLQAMKQVGRKNKVKEKPKGWIHFRNCIVDLNTWEKFDATPDYLLTEPIPHDFGGTHSTPTIDALFESWVDTEYVQTLFEVCAYVMLDDYPIHRIFLLYGSGRNGKGQFRDILKNIVGVNNTTATSLTGLTTNRFESSRLFKNKLCTIGETDFKTLESTAVIKMASGGDPVPAEFKGMPSFTFVNTAKLVMNTNALPPTNDKSEGFYSRWVILNFKNKFEKGKDIIDTIPPEEYDCLVSRLILILHDLLEAQAFCMEGSTEEKMDKYEAVSNPLADFITHHCVTDPNAWVPFSHFKTQFNVFLKDTGKMVYSDRNLRKYIVNEGYTLKADHWFNGLNRQLTGIQGVDLLVNPMLETDRIADGSLADFQNRVPSN